MTSVAGYTPPQTTADAGDGGTPPSQPPESPAEASTAPTQTYQPTETNSPQNKFKSQLDDIYKNLQQTSYG